jgi:hypothetical protein
MKRVVPIVILAAVLSCGQWKVTSYQSSKICSIPAGIMPGQVHIKVEDHGLLDLSFNVRLFGGKIYVSDNVLKRVQILDRDGKAQVLIGQKVPVPSGDSLIQSSFNFSVLGHIVADSDGNLYVQNRLMSREVGSGISEELDFSPSYVLKFDGEGKLQYTLGKTGLPNIPFDYIDSLEIDRKDRLVVVSRKFNTWSVSRFNGKNRDFSVNFVKSDFRDRENNSVFQGKIDNVRIMRDGDMFLISVSYYSGLRFKYRKIFNYSIQDSKITRTIMNIPDPKNELFSVVDNMHLYLWNVDEGQTKFAICNMEGNIVNNIHVKSTDRRVYFRDIQIDDSGMIYSYQVYRDRIDVMEWK